MKRYLIFFNSCLLILLQNFTFCVAVNAQTFQWAVGTGGTLSNIGLGVTIDNNGNSFYTGVFKGTADFDPGPGSFLLTATGAFEDIFIVKLDSASNFIWAKKVGATGYDKGESIITDSIGNLFITGSFNGSGDFDPGPAVFNLTSAGSGYSDIYILKLDNNGNFLWVKQIGSIGDDRGMSLSLDSDENLYTTGYFFYSVDFNPGSGVYNLSSAGDADIFILKLDAGGNFIYAKSAGGPYTDRGFEIKVSATGNVFTTGHFAGVADFDPGPGIYNLTYVGLYDIFVMKTDASGDFKWAGGMGSGDYEYGYSIAIDSDDNVYTTGNFKETVDFDPGPGIHNLTPVGGGNTIFISKLDSNGIFVFGKAFYATNFYNCDAYGIAIDQSGNIFITGFFSGTTDFDPGPGVYNLTCQGAGDLFLSKLDPDGNFIFANRYGGTGDDIGGFVAFDNSGNLFVTGGFQNSIILPSPSPVITSAGDYDIIFMKFSACFETSSTQNISRCSFYTSPSGNYTWTTSGNYSDTIYNTSGCDSIININLTILPFITPVIVGDTLICQGESSDLSILTSYSTYQWSNGSTSPSITVGANGNYTVTVTALNGCSGTANFHLSVSNPFVYLTSQGATTFCEGDSVSLTATPGFVSYQWYRRNSFIPGATSAIYIAKYSGAYKCVAQNASLCSDTSNVILINVPCVPIGPAQQKENIVDEENINPFMIFPNPGNGIFQIYSPSGNLQIFNSIGELVYETILTTSKNELNLSGIPDGIYHSKLQTDTDFYSCKIVIVR